MDARFQRRIQRYGWDKAAAAYEAGWKDSLADAHVELLQKAGARPGESVLDVACGTGLVTFALAEAVGPSGRLVATDLSGEMVERVKHQAEERGFRHVDAVRADAEDLCAYPDASFDLVTCALGLMYVPDPERALAEALRVLRPGGRAVMAVWGERSKCGWADIFPIVDARVASSVCPLFFRLGTRTALAHAMKQAGFAYVKSKRIASTLSYASGEAALDAVFAGGPVALAYDRFDAATRADAHKDYLHSIAAFASADGYTIPAEFVVCSASKRRAARKRG